MRMTLGKGRVGILDDKNSLNPQTRFFFLLLEFGCKLSLSGKSSFCLFCPHFLLSHMLSFQQLILLVTLHLAAKCLRMV